MVTNGPNKFGRINQVAKQYINEGFLQENVWRFLPGGQKSGHSNEVVILMR